MILEHGVSLLVGLVVRSVESPHPGSLNQGRFWPPGGTFGCHNGKACYWQSGWWRSNPTMHRMASYPIPQRMTSLQT